MLLLIIGFHKHVEITSICRGVLTDFRVCVFEISDSVSGYCSNIKHNFSQDIGTKLFSVRCDNVKLKLKADSIEAMIEENNRLKSLLNLKESAKHELVFAKVIDVFHNDFVRSALVDAGKNQNVQLDDFAYNEDGIIGRVIEVSDNWSKVLFIVDTNSNVPAKIAGMNAILSGDNSDLLKVNLLKEDIKEGDIAESSSYGRVFQDKIKIGTVIKKNDEFFVEPSVNFNDLKYVCIGRCLD